MIDDDCASFCSEISVSIPYSNQKSTVRDSAGQNHISLGSVPTEFLDLAARLVLAKTDPGQYNLYVVVLITYKF